MITSREVVAAAAGAAAGVLAWHRLRAYLRGSDAGSAPSVMMVRWWGDVQSRVGTEAHPPTREAPALGTPSDDAQTPSLEELAHPPSLGELSDQVLALLTRYSPTVVEGMDPKLHYLAPHVPKTKWTQLGDLVAARERCTSGSVDGARWLSLRLDGCGFSKAVRSLRSKGILEARGFSAIFADAMVSGLRALMEHFHATIGYTQSDEMVVFIAPASVVRGEQQPHIRSGRVAKLATLASGLLTAHFLMHLSAQCLKAGVGLEGLAQVLPHFDCRVASYSSWEEARSLLLWRANDCAVNGVSDAVYHIKGSGKAIQALGRREKAAWLWENGHLPLPRHQAYGSVLVKVRRVVTGHNPKAGTEVRKLRSAIEHIDGAVLELARTGTLFPKDDEL